jgi:hypothetical protein
MLAVVQYRPPAQRAPVRRILPLSLIGLLVLALAQSSLPPKLGPRGGTIDITATPVSLDPGNPGARRAGDTVFLRGWHLTSTSAEFGGLSAIRAWNGRWLTVEDTGALVFLSPAERTAELVPVHPRCLPGRVRLGRDLEGLDTDGRSIWVSAEWHNTICRLDPNGKQFGVRPAAMAHWPRYSGPETLLRLRDGRFLVLPEIADHAALLFDGDPVRGAKPTPLRYTPPDGYSPTDAAELPDGRIVILNRALTLRGFATKVVLFDGLPAKGIVQGRTILSLAAPLIHDNFEGIAARREGDATVLTLVSDDNNMWFQRTLLLEFRLDR